MPIRINTDGQPSSTIPDLVSSNTNLYNEYKCRAWVNFNGTGTVAIRGSGNVTSITDNNTGDYTVNFITAMPDANYSMYGCVRYDTGDVINTNLGIVSVKRTSEAFAAGSIRVITWSASGSALDCEVVSVGVFR